MSYIVNYSSVNAFLINARLFKMAALWDKRCIFVGIILQSQNGALTPVKMIRCNSCVLRNDTYLQKTLTFNSKSMIPSYFESISSKNIKRITKVVCEKFAETHTQTHTAKGTWRINDIVICKHFILCSTLDVFGYWYWYDNSYW